MESEPIIFLGTYNKIVITSNISEGQINKFPNILSDTINTNPINKIIIHDGYIFIAACNYFYDLSFIEEEKKYIHLFSKEFLQAGEKVTNLCLNEKFKRVYICCGKNIFCYNYETRILEKEIHSVSTRIYSIFLSDDNLYVSDESGRIFIYNDFGGTLKYTYFFQKVTDSTIQSISVASNDEDKFVICGCFDGFVYMLNDSLKIVNKFAAHQDIITKVVSSPDGKSFVTASADKKLKVWNLSDALNKNVEPKLVLESHTEWVWDAEFTDDGKKIVSCGADSKMIVWDAETGKVLFVKKSGLMGSLTGFTTLALYYERER